MRSTLINGEEKGRKEGVTWMCGSVDDDETVKASLEQGLGTTALVLSDYM